VLTAGGLPGPPAIGRIDDGTTPDVAVPCSLSQHVALFLNQGNGTLRNPILVALPEAPSRAAIADFNLDGRSDLAVLCPSGVYILFGRGGVAFTIPFPLLQEPTLRFQEMTVADVDRNGIPDILVSDGTRTGAYLVPGSALWGFGVPVYLELGAVPGSIGVGDLDGDGLPEVTGTTRRSLRVLPNAGTGGFDAAQDHFLGFNATRHRFADMDADGVMDVVAYERSHAVVVPGAAGAAASASFRRGDTDGNGLVNLTDGVVILQRLFLGGTVLPCLDAADVNDDGTVELTDTVALFLSLFLGRGPLPPPGPQQCGWDWTPDDLEPCSGGCGG
jgi:hypothetical protein